MAKSENREIRHSIQRRLEFIEFRLYWEGQINRSDLVDTFGISVPQASADLRRYQELSPDAIEYDSHGKTYRPTEKFAPLQLEPSGDAYLARLRLRESGFVGKGETWAQRMPEFSIVPILRRTVEPEILREIIASIRSSFELKIKYQSAGSNTSRWRWIAPHALGFDGFSWHTRAWCQRNEDFRDFVLTRVLEVAESRSVEVDTATDAEWNESVTLLLKPNPELSPGAKKAVELDFGMVKGISLIETRVSLSFYLERHLGLDQDPKLVRPERQRIVLVNRDEVERIRAKTKISAD